MPPCDRLPQAVTMPPAIGTERILLIGVASLSHAMAIEPPPSARLARDGYDTACHADNTDIRLRGDATCCR